ncbi:UPF0182 family protein [Knoellia sp. 3-2P3]|uniref:UPF0182 family membrane protein n=1 Tax=unclassified Knoellia TaxID=2618719 RepID=UPI0023D9AE2A|nr:UPF0182 family protein [Knoellia sp. 3-2P3]MDF2093464.1 UPF0182 family protein [Knoellia sp. 3-2P3]
MGRPGGGRPGGRGPLGLRRKRGPLGPTVAILGALAVLVSLAAGLWTDILWFDSLGYTHVFTTEVTTKVLLFTVGFILTAGLVASSLVVGYRTRPVYAPVTPQQQNLDQYREAIEPLRRVATIGIPVILGFLAGTGAAGQWKAFLLWRNSVPFGKKDPHFGIDIAFFVFTLPWLRFVLGFLTMMLIMALIAAAFTHYVYGGVQLQGRGERTTRAARTHLAVLVAALVVVRAGSYWVDRYSLVTKESDLLTGLKYTDATAVMPTKAILAVASLMTAALFIASIWTRSWRLPVIGVALLTVTAVVVGGIYPALMQNFRVKPSEKTYEAKYLDRSIRATRAAYGLEGVETQVYEAGTTATRNQLRDDADTIPGIRLVDPNVVSPTFQQLQAVKSYYGFPDSLDVDRYTIDGKKQDTVIAVRELDLAGVPANQRNWLNDHTVYTHGFGLVAAYGNRRGEDGQPVFYQQNIPPVGKLPTFEPRIYFGEKSPTYSIVGASEGTRPREFDYPDSSAAGQKNNTYNGSGGVEIGSFMRQAAYAIKYRELKFLLSDAVNEDSRLLYTREPLERVKKVAPWLTLDGNPYPAVVGGRIQWIVDGYTTSADYPYSRLQDIDNATSDSVTETSSAVRAISTGQINYIRNSVKATVDAFDGSVRLYTWDEQDPVLKAWSKAFDGTVRPMSEISGDLMSHLRYPEDLFKVQRMVLSRYHVTDADSFYGGQDFWRVPNDPTREDTASAVYQPPYYLTLAMPGQQSPSFSLTTTFQPTGDREVLSGFLAVDADAGSEDGTRKAGYGKLRLLELPRDTTVKGPGQVANDINSSNVTSEAFTLTLNQFLNQSRQQGSRVTMGNLLTLPVGGGLLYVQPIYVRASGTSAYPLSRATVVAFGDKLAWSDTLTGALDGLFGGSSGAEAGDTGSGSGPTPTKPPTGSDAAALAQALEDIQAAYDDGREALKNGDFAAYGEAQKRLDDAIQRAVEAAPQGGTATVTPTPTGTATPTPTTTR